MMIEPPIDKLIEKAGCKYSLVNVTAKRARAILNKHVESMEESLENPVTEAAKEIYAGEVIISKED